MSCASIIVDNLLEADEFDARSYLLAAPRPLFVVRHPGWGGLYWSKDGGWRNVGLAKPMTEQEAKDFVAPYNANGYRLDIEKCPEYVKEGDDDFDARDWLLNPPEKPGKRIRISYSLYTEDSIEAGDAADHGWEDEEGVEMDPDEWDIEDGITAAQKATKFLNEKGAIHPSSSQFHPGIWYNSSSNDWNNDNELIEYSYHLSGFTPEEEQEIFNEVAMKI